MTQEEIELIQSLSEEAAGYEGRAVGVWWCVECKEEVHGYYLTDDHHHIGCGGFVTQGGLDYENDLNDLYRFVDWVIRQDEFIYCEHLFDLLCSNDTSQFGACMEFNRATHAQRFEAAVLTMREVKE